MQAHLPALHSWEQTLTVRTCWCRLIFAGKQMSDEKSAKDFNIEGGSVLHLVGHPSVSIMLSSNMQCMRLLGVFVLRTFFKSFVWCYAIYWSD